MGALLPVEGYGKKSMVAIVLERNHDERRRL